MLRRLLSVKPWHLSLCSLTWSPSSASSSPSSPTMASSTSSWRWNKHLTSALVSSQLLPDLRSDQICTDMSFSQVFSQVSTNLVLTGLLSSYINSTARNSRSPQGRRRIRGFQVEWCVFLFFANVTVWRSKWNVLIVCHFSWRPASSSSSAPPCWLSSSFELLHIWLPRHLPSSPFA